MIRIAVALLVAGITRAALAQGGHEVEVYRSDVMAPRTFMFELHTNYTIRGPDPAALATLPPDDLRPLGVQSFDPVCYNPATPFYLRSPSSGGETTPAAAVHATVGCDLYGVVSLDHSLGETIEMVTGLTRWSEIAVYAYGTKQGSDPAVWAGATVRAKVRVPGSWRWPVGVALSTEIEYDRSQVSISTMTWEIRPIVDRTLGRWYISFNPTIERRLRGPGIVNGLQFLPSGKVSFDVTSKITAGLEYYADYGTIGTFAAPNDRPQQVYGAVDLHLSPRWEINGGVGFGITPAAGQLAAKLILGRAITW